MKLYMWNDPYSTDGGCFAYVVANSESEARQLVKEAARSKYGDFHQPEAPAGDIEGPPDQVYDTPCAAIVEWPAYILEK